MAEHTGPKPSSAVEQVDKQTGRRPRKATIRARERPMGAPIAGPLPQIANRDEERSGGLTAVRTSAEIASASKSTAAVRETTDDETVHEAVGSPEALPEESEEIKRTVTNEIGSRVPVPEAVAQASTERPAPWEIERKLELETALQPTTEHAFARWREALWEAVHGRWSEAGWEFARGAFHLLTRARTWRRVGKAVLNFLARFVPGREDAISRRSREIKELFQFLHEEPKKPGTWSNCPK